MNTVDALKDLYKTLCGKDYAGDPNPTDAEMIKAIAKDASTGGGSGSGGKIIVDVTDDPGITVSPIASGLSMEELAKYQVIQISRVDPETQIIPRTTINAEIGTPVSISDLKKPKKGETVRITYKFSGSVTNYVAQVVMVNPYTALIEFEQGVIEFGDRSTTFTATKASGQVTITVVEDLPDEPVNLGAANNISVVRYGEPDTSTFTIFYTIGPGDAAALYYNRSTGEIIAEI